jgi:hypothetical protein
MAIETELDAPEHLVAQFLTGRVGHVGSPVGTIEATPYARATKVPETTREAWMRPEMSGMSRENGK